MAAGPPSPATPAAPFTAPPAPARPPPPQDEEDDEEDDEEEDDEDDDAGGLAALVAGDLEVRRAGLLPRVFFCGGRVGAPRSRGSLAPLPASNATRAFSHR